MKLTRDDNEYHLIFNEPGPYTLVVYRNGEEDTRLPTKEVRASEIMKLINPADGKFKSALYFDEFLLKIDSYSIHLAEKEIRIHLKEGQ